jgi:hypothetical protein
MKKFLVSTADVYGYDSNSNLVIVGKTLLDSSIETTLGNTDVRAGRGNQLQYIYYHTAEMNINISDAQWNLDFLSKQVGQDIVTGSNVYTEETITLGALGAGTVAGTPLAVSGTTIYGWVTHEDGVVERVTFSGSNFTSSHGVATDVVCVRYYALNAAARSLTIPSNFVPSIIRLVMVAQLASSDASTNIIGEVQIEVPKGSLTGAFTISLTPDGVASTPLAVRALAANEAWAGCTTQATYAKIDEIIYNTNWYDNVVGISIEGGDFSLTHPSTKQLIVRAIPLTGAAFIPPTSGLTFSSATVGTATISASGLVTSVAAGTSLLKVTITAKTAIDANVVVTV